MKTDWMSRADHAGLFFAWEEVRAAFEAMDPNLGETPVDFAKEMFMDRAEPCPACGRRAEELRWASIGTSDEAWERGDERCGWIVVCDLCSIQVSFVLDEEMTQLRREGSW